MQVKFLWNGIKVDGKLYRAFYSEGKLIHYPEGTITIFAKDYEHFPKIEGLTVENDTELQSDYFETDRIYVTPGNTHYPAVIEAMKQKEAHYTPKPIKPDSRIDTYIANMKATHAFIKSGTWKDIQTRPGKKYVRLVSILSNDQVCAIGFIDPVSGDVYRANGWKQKGHKIGSIGKEPNP